jgi:MoxR-like ATPase
MENALQRPNPLASVEAVRDAFAGEDYVCDRPLALAVKLAWSLRKPLLLEGEAGVGKTEVGKALARILATELIRLQCYEGLDAQSAIYEWNYAKQILHIRLADRSGEPTRELESAIFSDEFLLSRPLLRAIRHPGPDPAVLLVDEVDRADEEFEAFLLEILSDAQVTVPELGTFRAVAPPLVVLTSNRTRELNDGLKRRCLYLWMDYPSPAKERDIVIRKVPGISSKLAREVAAAVARLRSIEFYKRPGVAETLDWARALVDLGAPHLDPAILQETAGCVLKYREDLERLRTLEPEKILGRELEGP